MDWLTNSLTVVLASAGMLYIGYKTYGRFLCRKVLNVDDGHITPAVYRSDGLDFVPTAKPILFGHHFASIAGLGPIVGPAIAIVWGWLPALLWVVLGSILIGGVHDLTTLVVSIRHKAATIGVMTRHIIGVRAQVLFLLLSFFLIALAMGVFVLVMVGLFAKPQPNGSPESLIPTLSLIAIAMVVGLLVYKARWKLLPVTLLGLAAMAAVVIVGMHVPVSEAFRAWSGWTYVLLGYAFIASVLPVWLLLQPRDYINSYLLYGGLAMLVVGFVVVHPHIQAPAVAFGAVKDIGMFPFLLIIIACGAVSGFHSLVSSGTTARQLRKESDARVIGYGAMLVEGLLAALVICVIAAALPGGLWRARYQTGKLPVAMALPSFLTASGELIARTLDPLTGPAAHATTASYASTFMAVVVVSFAMTTLDSGTRLLRYIVEAMGRLAPWRRFRKVTGNRYVASAVAIAGLAMFALMKVPDASGKFVPAGRALWTLFGVTNQLFAALALLLVSVYLWAKRKPIWYTLVPMAGMLVMVAWAMALKIRGFLSAYETYHDATNLILLIVSFVLLVLAGWVCFEAAAAFFLKKRVEEASA